jgi:Glycosyl hydrolase family 12
MPMRRVVFWTVGLVLGGWLGGCSAGSGGGQALSHGGSSSSVGSNGSGAVVGTPTGGAGGTPGAVGGTPGAVGGTPGAVGGTPGAVGGTPGAGGTTAGTVGAGGDTGGTVVTCTNTDLTTLPVDASGWIARECNDRDIQGPFYCYTDKINPTDCMDGVVPYRAGSGMCISGSTTVDATFAAYGAGIGIGLNESGGDASVKMPYDAAANGVLGFHIEITGSSGDLPIRIGFTNEAAPTGSSPFVEVPGPGSYDILLADALVPEAWGPPDGGKVPNPNAIYDIQVQIVGGNAAASYDFCVASVTPITDGSTPVGGNVAPYGSQQCSELQTINLGSTYMVQNNVYNANGGMQCIQALWDNAANAGFIVNPVSLNVPAGSAPASYPSVVLGWHYGTMYGSYTSARQLSSITSIPSSWSFTVPGSGRYNASYDLWLHPSQTNPANPGGGLELMVWLNQRDTTPIGSSGPSVTIGQDTWTVWYGPNSGGWNTVSYIRATNTTSVTNLDINQFIQDAVTRGYATSSTYLLGVQAGFEIWEQNQSMTSGSYTVSIN